MQISLPVKACRLQTLGGRCLIEHVSIWGWLQFNSRYSSQWNVIYPCVGCCSNYGLILERGPWRHNSVAVTHQAHFYLLCILIIQLFLIQTIFWPLAVCHGAQFDNLRTVSSRSSDELRNTKVLSMNSHYSDLLGTANYEDFWILHYIFVIETSVKK